MPFPELATAIKPLVRWPSLAEMRGITQARRSNVGRQLRLGIGVLRTLPYRAVLEAAVQRHRHWGRLFSGRAKSFEPLVHAFIDRRLGVADRFAHLYHDLDCATRFFGLPSCDALAQGRRVPVWALGDEGGVDLGLNAINNCEGLWALGLWTRDGVRVCQLSFSFQPGGRLMIGSVQGPPLGDQAGMDGIRHLTHAAEGLRPPYLLVEVLRALCRRWGLALAGVDPAHHPKKKWHQRELQVAFDYRTFWLELGGHRRADDSWTLPLQRPPRDLASVPAKRRACYRRRAAMLDAMPGQLQRVA
jgi:hypothetical protein